MPVDVDSQREIRRFARARPWVAITAAAIVVALIPLIGLPLYIALSVIGLLLAMGAPPDYVASAKTIARQPRNLVLGIYRLPH